MKKTKILVILIIVLLIFIGTFFVIKELLNDDVSDILIISRDGVEYSLKKEKNYKNIIKDLSDFEDISENNNFKKKIEEIIVIKRGLFKESKYEVDLLPRKNSVKIREVDGENRVYLLKKEFAQYILDYYLDVESREFIKEDTDDLTVEGRKIKNSDFFIYYDGTYEEYNVNNESDDKINKEIKDEKKIILKINEPDIKFDLKSDLNRYLKITKDGEDFWSGSFEEKLFVPSESGIYEYYVYTEKSNDLVKYQKKYHFIVDLELPSYYIFSSTEMEQGGFIELIVKNPRVDEEPFIKSDHSIDLKFTKDKNGGYISVIPSSYGRQIGKMNIKYGYKDDVREKEIKITERNFSVQELEVSQDVVQKTMTDEAYDEFNKYYPPSLTKDLYFPDVSSVNDMNFVLPTSGVLTTEYGETRHINGSPTHYHHSGLDIAWDSETEVLSTADGVVALARNLQLTGNTVVISHGFGIFSTYYHLSEIDVKEGDFVKMGSKIGFQGNTGFSTGVHLHFMISYGDVNLEPGYFIYKEKVTYENYKNLFGDKAR